MEKRLFRNGDLLIREIDAIPKDAKRVKTNILALGESTGHTHQLIGECKVFENKEGKKFFQSNEELELIHQEHKPITIEAGTFEVLIEREYSPFDEEIRQVQD